MSSDLRSVAGDLEAYLKENVPTSWKVQDANLTLGATTGVVLTYTLLGFSNRIAGAQLPYSHLGADFQLTLSAPEKDLVKAQTRLLEALPHLIEALDTANGITWETAERAVLEGSGESVFTINLSILVTTSKD